jgi:dienelactone hydrolase
MSSELNRLGSAIGILLLAATALTACGGAANRPGIGTDTSAAACGTLSSQPAEAAPWENTGIPLTGPHTVVIAQAPDPLKQTLYRPATATTEPWPVVAWGNGGCGANGLAVAEYLAEIASHGYLVISNGVPHGEGGDPRDGSTHIAALDWAVEQNGNSCSSLFNQLDTDHIAVMGYSCGGLMSLNAGGDPRVSTVVALNSGLLAPDAAVYDRLHTPVAYFNGGEADIAYENGLRDYRNISHVPVLHANLSVGHGGTYDQDNGGEYAKASLAWLNWHLKGDLGETGRQMFLGDTCGLCNTEWVLEHKNF